MKLFQRIKSLFIKGETAVQAAVPDLFNSFTAMEKQLTDYMASIQAQANTHTAAINDHNIALASHQFTLERAGTLLGNLKKFLTEKL